ncbi:23S rRNA (uracil(1939)-C(5))-methyltransferase RlmD [Lapidilactobacillus achengensis]|uniref:23S rRNA (Uracil(1939)-C(5))-methyltransferase RlmD n=1 Tax=Lapidilactobacillus achengensis TaxID=2486000 RepID=A0ABW1UKW6_9LACO|nr:23S rRNA (uracil(1939)-C(5))-methyltransferase RlmD [Lapidilactobacillus achengensis]
MAKIQAPVRKNEKGSGTVTDLTYEAMGVIKVDDYPLFIANVLPGEEIDYLVTKVNAHYGFARVLAVKKASPDRVEGVERVYLQAGIAPLAQLSYPAQLKFKQQQVINLLAKVKLPLTVAPTIGADQQTGYRNKAQVPVRTIKGVLETGIYRQKSHDLLPLSNFLIQAPQIDATIKAVRDLLREFGVPAYNEQYHSGVIRHIMVRRGQATGQQMVVLVSKQRHLPHEIELIEAIAALPEVVSIIINYNPKTTNVILGAQERLVHGQPYIEDELLGHKFHISAQSFYQVNHDQTEKLYQTAIDAADLQPDDVVVDAYSGIGTIGISVAEKVKTVKEIEVVPEAVADAKANAQLNGLTNLEFTVGKAEEVMPTWAEQQVKMDVLFVDPPRKGLSPEFVAAVLQVKPAKIVYISCNPATLVRDLRLLVDGGYEAKTVQPVDMFPLTNHVESVVALTRVEK